MNPDGYAHPAAADISTTEDHSAPAEAAASSSSADCPDRAPAAETVSDGGESWSNGWEAEDEPSLPSGDAGITTAASTINRGLAAHQAIVDDADWSDVEIYLPYPGRLWARNFREGFDAGRHLEELLLGAMQEGRTSLQNIETFLSNTSSGLPDERLGQHLVTILEDVGVLVEDELLFPPYYLLPEASRGRTAHDKSIVREILELLDELTVSPPADIGLIKIEARRFSPPSSEDERRMFLRHQACLNVIIRLAAPHPAGRGVILDWIRDLESGKLSVSDLTNQGGHSIKEEDDQELAHAEPSEVDLLMKALRQAAATPPVDASAGHDGCCAEKIIALSLTPPRIIEFAERVCSAGVAIPLPDGSIQETEWSPESYPTRHETRKAGRTGNVSKDVTAVIGQLDKATGAYRDARDLILKTNLRLVIWQARRYTGALVATADLVQEGIIGLLRAIERFDPDRGSRFGTYAIWWIRQSMTRALADKGRTIRIPVHLLDGRNRLQKIREMLHGRLGREPDVAELAVASGQTADVVQRIWRTEIEMVPLEQALRDELEDPCDEEPTSARSASIIGFEQSPLDTLLHADLRRCLGQGLRQLDPRARKILILRFGLEDDTPRTLEEVGQIYGVTRERIRQVEAKAIKRIRRMLPAKHFEAMQP